MAYVYVPTGYLPPGYLPVGWINGDTGAITGAVTPDSPTILDDIVKRLQETGAFGYVGVGGNADEIIAEAGNQYPAAAVELLDWVDASTWDADTQTTLERFQVTILVGDRSVNQSDRQARILAQTARNAINRKSLAGITLAAFTFLNRGRWQRRNSESRIVLSGEYRYWIEDDGLNETQWY